MRKQTRIYILFTDGGTVMYTNNDVDPYVGRMEGGVYIVGNGKDRNIYPMVNVFEITESYD